LVQNRYQHVVKLFSSRVNSLVNISSFFYTALLFSLHIPLPWSIKMNIIVILMAASGSGQLDQSRFTGSVQPAV